MGGHLSQLEEGPTIIQSIFGVHGLSVQKKIQNTVKCRKMEFLVSKVQPSLRWNPTLPASQPFGVSAWSYFKLGLGRRCARTIIRTHTRTTLEDDGERNDLRLGSGRQEGKSREPCNASLLWFHRKPCPLRKTGQNRTNAEQRLRLHLPAVYVEAWVMFFTADIVCAIPACVIPVCVASWKMGL